MNEKIPGAGSHHIALASADFDRSLRFYTEGLGMRPAAAWGEGEKRAALLDIGDGSHIEIFANGSDAPQQNERYVHFAIRTGDPDAAFANAIAAGAKEKMPPTTLEIPANPPMPVRIAFVYGPDGEVLEFFEEL
ncbi:MAG: VOC family protein [Oscillospiraceae bacterium]|nr:VOC family protein [Oscillospiraceae bacterium]